MAANIGALMIIKRSIKTKKDNKMGIKNSDNMALKMKKEMCATRSRVVRIKALVDNEYADDIEFLLTHMKPTIGINASVFFGKKILENNRKFIIEMKNGMKELLESEQEDEQSSEQNGAEK